MKITETQIQNAAKGILEGQVALLPTDTVYGLGASPLHPSAIDKIFELKNRPPRKNLPIMVASMDDLKDLGVDLNENVVQLFQSEFIPGALTLVLGFTDKPLVDWLEGRDEIAVRIPDTPYLLEILKKTGPLLVTSANRSGVGETPPTVEEILAQLNGTPEIVLEGGYIKSIPSTILNCRLHPPKVEREGIIKLEQLIEIYE